MDASKEALNRSAAPGTSQIPQKDKAAGRKAGGNRRSSGARSGVASRRARPVGERDHGRCKR